MKRGDLVRRLRISNVPVLGGPWEWPPDKIFLVTRGSHEGVIYWTDRATTVGIVIDIIDPGSGVSYMHQPIADFSVVRF